MEKHTDLSKFHSQVKHKSEPSVYDPIALMVRDRFDRARQWRNIDKIGEFSIEQVLHNCYRQYNGITDPADYELLTDANSSVKISLTKHKVDVLVAWTRDLLGSNEGAPFLIEPTPIPSLSKAAKEAAVAKMRDRLLMGGFDGSPDQVIELARQIKEQQFAEEMRHAQTASKAMQRLIEDQLVEANFRAQQMDFLTNFALYPYAVMVGPSPEMIPVFEWRGNRPVVGEKAVLKTYNVSPFDYYWSSDTYQAGKGTYDLIKVRMTKMALLQCAELPGYIKDNVLQAVKHFSRPDMALDWLSGNPDMGPSVRPWAHDESIDLIKHFGALSGRELRLYGMTGVEDDKFYECEATVLGSWTIRLVMNPNPNPSQRPVYCASYQRVPGKMVGYGIAQNVRDIERSFMAAYRGLMENIGYSSAPMGEVDFSRIQRYMAEDQIGSLMPATMVPTDPDMTGGGRPAHYFHSMPNVSNQLLAVMQYFTELADRQTGIPASMSGQPIGTGVNRTFRGIMALYGNALKGVQSALSNLDKDIFEPLGRAYFSYNMKYAKDQSVRGDAMVRARGTEGILQKEIAKQGNLENLQIIAQLAQTGQLDPRVLNWAVAEVLSSIGAPLDELGIGEEPMSQPMPAEQGQPPVDPQQGMI